MDERDGKPSGLIEIRKLAAADMAWAGPRKIFAEYVLGVLLPLALGVLSLRAGLAADGPWWQLLLGLGLLGIGANYVPLALHAFDLIRRDRVEIEGRPEIAHARRYGTQQVMLIVPFLVFVIAIAQGRSRGSA
ncbi:MAG TPA: hypothetical protein VF001_01430 [Candidatus Limnocylindria bacterium]